MMDHLLIRHIWHRLRLLRDYLQLPAAAKLEHRLDRQGLSRLDPGNERAIEAAMGWLGRAQDYSASHDGGVARHYSLRTGWGASYPETTGYIVPTMLAYGELSGDQRARQRARRMTDWLVSIQFPEGYFQGGVIDSTPVVPVVFNTGQILFGLASSAREFDDARYYKATRRAADWLVRTQDPEGCWRRYASPFASAGEKTYDAHVAWALLDAARVMSNPSYAEAALANIRWVLTWQRDNGWFDNCSLGHPLRPLTHTLGYLLRGVIEAYRYTQDAALLCACRKTADGLLTALEPDGFLPGYLGPNWRSDAFWSCLTGTVQIACCWFFMYEFTGDCKYRDAAYAANQYVRRTLKIDGPPNTRGAIKGSYPVFGDYNPYQYLNWAGKFFVDANILEKAVRDNVVV